MDVVVDARLIRRIGSVASCVKLLSGNELIGFKSERRVLGSSLKGGGGGLERLLRRRGKWDKEGFYEKREE